MDQQDSFDFHPEAKDKTFPLAPGYSNDSTSKAAAESMKPSMGRLQKRIYDHIKAHAAITGLTARQVEEDLSMRTQTVTARIRELVLLGKLKDSGEKRLTDSNRKAIVWKAVD